MSVWSAPGALKRCAHERAQALPKVSAPTERSVRRCAQPHRERTSWERAPSALILRRTTGAAGARNVARLLCPKGTLTRTRGQGLSRTSCGVKTRSSSRRPPELTKNGILGEMVQLEIDWRARGCDCETVAQSGSGLLPQPGGDCAQSGRRKCRTSEPAKTSSCWSLAWTTTSGVIPRCQDRRKWFTR